MRTMNCFKFVHLAAYLAGPQLLTAGGGPRVSGDPTGVYTSQRFTAYDRLSNAIIPRNKIVVGVAHAFNNSSGYYHVGISVGDGTIVSLGSGQNVHVQRGVLQFPLESYRDVRVADYPWMPAQGGSNAPLPTPF
jgi:hypothetical protein